ncbi:MAG: 50S ribosomal protein L25 [Deltaproteobacteria bacterium]|nr:50S ribosomal protein L25 [Deltaproteobacteria bacterium]
MDQVQLTVEARKAGGKGVARRVRAAGKIPGVIYGKGFENILVQVDPKEFKTALASSSTGQNTLINIKIQGHEALMAMIKDYQADVLTREYTHLDFLKIDLNKKIRVDVVIEVVGKAEGVKEGGILEIIRREVPVICLPTAIPKSIPVDVTSLKVGSSVHVNDLKLSEGIEIPHDVNYTLISIVAPKEEVVVAAVAQAAEPEVLTAKKPAEGEEAKKPDAKKVEAKKPEAKKAEAKGDKK